MISFAVADVVQARIISIANNQVGVNVLTYVVTNIAGASKTYGDGALRISTLVAAAYKALLCAQATYRGVGCRKIFPNPKSIEYPDVSLNGAGTSGPTLLPKQTSGLLRKTSDRPGEKGRGRTYIPFPSTADTTTNGVPINTYGTRLQTLGDILKAVVVVGTAPDTATLKPVLWDRELFQATDVGNFAAQLYWATQKRRGDYGKPNFLPW